MNMTKVETIEELEVLEKNEPYVLFKHSTTCRLVMVPIQNFKRIVVKKGQCQLITYTYKMREMFQIVLQNSTALNMNLRKCYT